ncbi:hypothetical protein E2I00_010804 [Balaenoptera physalus]|uniref:Endonuclease/exonuclease/phosphatase domain-containing protein n=1 Tax=Balaenoptera physalus TaxID=9770 RepID=A0A6A1QHP9_BALPH|nr:hypothetical protein E2I00_010804 [Balaenoptera physalus]
MPLPLASLLLLLLSTHSALALRICSFNVRSFGESKKANCNAMDVIVKVIKRCDIILLMEIKDRNNIICPTLMERLNGEKLVSVKASYLYHDYQAGDAHVFSREPFVVWFQSPHTAVKDFVIVPLHTTPETSVQEIDELADVYVDVKRRWKAEVMTLCVCWIPICRGRIWSLRGTSDSEGGIVLRGQDVVTSVVPQSNSIFDFQKAYRLTEEKALDVSDHFPVEFKLQSSRAFTNSKESVSPKKKKKTSRA